MSNPERHPDESDLRGGTGRERRGDGAARRAARRPARDAGASYAPAAAPLADRRLVLRGPLRARRRRRHRRHERGAAPAHRAADGELAVHRRDRAPRQRGQPRDGAARRGQPDDRRPRDQPLGGLHRRTRACCTARSCGSRCPTPTGTPTRASPTTRPSPVTGRRLGGAGLPRLAARQHLAGRHVHPAARRRAAAGARHHARRSTSTRPSSTASSSTPGVRRGGGRPRPSSTSSPTSRPARDRLTLDGVRRARAAAAARRPAVRGVHRDVVELRRPQPRGDRGLPRGVAGPDHPRRCGRGRLPGRRRRPLRRGRRRPPAADPGPARSRTRGSRSAAEASGATPPGA